MIVCVWTLMGTKQSTSANLHQHDCKPLISQCSLTPVFLLAILTARMLAGAMVPTVRMESVGQVLTALHFFITQRILPASILAARTVV